MNSMQSPLNFRRRFRGADPRARLRFGNPIVVLLIALAACVATAGTPFWNWRNPTPQGNDYQAVVFGGERFVAVGSGGTIVTSTDGVTWTPAVSGVRASLGTLAYGNGRFVTRGYVSKNLVSDDGVTWVAPEAAVPAEWSKMSTLAFAGGRFWALSRNLHFAATSPDGVTWTKDDAASAANVGRITASAAGDLLLGYDTGTGNLGSPGDGTWNFQEVRMLRSENDGASWSDSGLTGLAALSAGPVQLDGVWMVGGTQAVVEGSGLTFRRALSSSIDGGRTWTVTWSEPSPYGGNAPVFDLKVFNDRAFMLGIQGSLVKSTADGVVMRSDWADTTPGPPITLNAVAAGNDRLVAVGRYGQLLSTANGAEWTSARHSAISGDLRGAAYGDGRWIVAGNTGLATSTDGVDWQALPAAAAYGSGSIAYGNNRWVAGRDLASIGVSTDGGATWTTNPDFKAGLRKVVFAAGRFVGMVTPSGQNERLMWSTDGLLWADAVGTGDHDWSEIAVADDVFYAGGGDSERENGVIVRSVDGANWTTVREVSSTVSAIAGNDYWLVAATFDGQVLTSNDGGVVWALHGNTLSQSHGPPASFVSVGSEIVGVTYYGRIVTTRNGRDWEVEDFNGATMIFDLAFANNQLIAVGNGGVIWESGTSRFVNNSSRARVGTGDNVLIAGLVIGGDRPQQVLVRAAGPALQDRGVGDSLSVPILQLIRADGAIMGVNVGWTTSASPARLAEAAEQVGAFSFSDDNADSAILITLDPGGYTAIVSGAEASTGVALVEVYAVDGEESHLVNLSTRAQVGTGDDILIAGFVVAGDAPQRVLVRGIGPALGVMDVFGALEQPVVKVLRGTAVLATNQGWTTADNAAEIAAAAAEVGAFPLDASLADSSLLLTLNPGLYTVHVVGADNTTGVALAEIYQVP